MRAQSGKLRARRGYRPVYTFVDIADIDRRSRCVECASAGFGNAAVTPVTASPTTISAGLDITNRKLDDDVADAGAARADRRRPASSRSQSLRGPLKKLE
jgi:hypothetical protein